MDELERARVADYWRTQWRIYWPLFHATRDEAAACVACNPPAELEPITHTIPPPEVR